MLEPGKNETSNFQELLRSEQIPFEESTCQGHNIPIFHFCSRSASSSGCRQGSSQRKTQPKRPRCCILSPAYWEIRMVWNNERENVLQFFFFASSELIYVISDIFNSCKTQHPESSESALVPLKQVHPQ